MPFKFWSAAQTTGRWVTKGCSAGTNQLHRSTLDLGLQGLWRADEAQHKILQSLRNIKTGLVAASINY
jgi:hypothetical protein